jgi:hypothetical protein
MFKLVEDIGHASATSDASLSVVTTLPGLLAMYLVYTFEKWLLNYLNTPTLRSWRI